jgi:hypothetical protein
MHRNSNVLRWLAPFKRLKVMHLNCIGMRGIGILLFWTLLVVKQLKFLVCAISQFFPQRPVLNMTKALELHPEGHLVRA